MRYSKNIKGPFGITGKGKLTLDKDDYAAIGKLGKKASDFIENTNAKSPGEILRGLKSALLILFMLFIISLGFTLLPTAIDYKMSTSTILVSLLVTSGLGVLFLICGIITLIVNLASS